MEITRLGPIITPQTHPAAGDNINGPSLVRVPDWVEDPLGRWYLYFADHKGDHIRLAHADEITGPYTLHEPGSLHLGASRFPTTTPHDIAIVNPIQAAAVEAEGHDAHFTPHIASPDVVVDHERQLLWMAFHGLCADGSQLSRMAESSDGIDFRAHDALIAFPYLRILPQRFDGKWLAMSMPGILYRSDDLRVWEAGAMVFGNDFRHCALLRRAEVLHVFWTRVGDAPEHVLHSTIDLAGDWSTWTPKGPQSVLWPEEAWEGADLDVAPSARGQVTSRVRQLRDPAIVEDGDRVYLVYAVAGESGLALAELHGI